jgi:hypothetical protein
MKAFKRTSLARIEAWITRLTFDITPCLKRSDVAQCSAMFYSHYTEIASAVKSLEGQRKPLGLCADPGLTCPDFSATMGSVCCLAAVPVSLPDVLQC